jgi:2-polyprenyl-6-methoxyphenol hydroxylase-like FAD-dependent oxidoreductase
LCVYIPNKNLREVRKVRSPLYFSVIQWTDFAKEWNKDANLDQVLKVYEAFDPRLLDVIRVADPSSIKVWELIDMENLPTWIKGKVGLLGDAAHPFLPRK